ncbi:unnamed protein product, partial [Iphiclides podalirius]
MEGGAFATRDDPTMMRPARRVAGKYRLPRDLPIFASRLIRAKLALTRLDSPAKHGVRSSGKRKYTNYYESKKDGANLSACAETRQEAGPGCSVAQTGTAIWIRRACERIGIRLSRF